MFRALAPVCAGRSAAVQLGCGQYAASAPPVPPIASPSLPSQPIQARLTVNPVGDVYEQEADRVAALVMRMPSDDEQETATPAPLQVQTARSADVGVGAVEPAVEDRIAALRGRGQPLPGSEQAFFSERFGHSFANVRIHHDSESDALANALQAEAFTVGSDIVFRSGTFTPGDTRSRQLVAHELTHVIQQTGGAPTAGQGSGTVQAKGAIQRTPAADEGVCPVCGKVGKGTCPDCGSPFLPIQRQALPGASSPSPMTVSRVIQRKARLDKDTDEQEEQDIAVPELGALREQTSAAQQAQAQIDPASNGQSDAPATPQDEQWSGGMFSRLRAMLPGAPRPLADATLDLAAHDDLATITATDGDLKEVALSPARQRPQLEQPATGEQPRADVVGETAPQHDMPSAAAASAKAQANVITPAGAPERPTAPAPTPVVPTVEGMASPTAKPLDAVMPLEISVPSAPAQTVPAPVLPSVNTAVQVLGASGPTPLVSAAETTPVAALTAETAPATASAPAPAAEHAPASEPSTPSGDQPLLLTAEAAPAPSLAGMPLDEAWTAMQDHIGATKEAAFSAAAGKLGALEPAPAAKPPEQSAPPSVETTASAAMVEVPAPAAAAGAVPASDQIAAAVAPAPEASATQPAPPAPVAVTATPASTKSLIREQVAPPVVPEVAPKAAALASVPEVAPQAAAPTSVPEAVAQPAAPAPAPVAAPAPEANPALDVADDAAQKALRQEEQRPDVVVQRFGLGDVVDAVMPDWVKGALDSLRGDARGKEGELNSAGSADKGTIDSQAQTQGEAIRSDGQSGFRDGRTRSPQALRRLVMGW